MSKSSHFASDFSLFSIPKCTLSEPPASLIASHLHLPYLLGLGHKPPTHAGCDEQADQNRLQDFDPGVGGNHAGDGREQRAACLCEDEDEACGVGFPQRAALTMGGKVGRGIMRYGLPRAVCWLDFGHSFEATDMP